jgi:large-conductance mechanosensitive channel
MSSIVNESYRSFVEFLNFFNKEELVNILVGMMLSINMNELSQTLVDSIIMPILKIIFGDDEMHHFDELEIVIYNARFRIGKLISVILRIVITMYLVYILIVYLPNKITG